MGRLGRAFFPKGFYVYVGSAQRNLPQRLARHLRNAGICSGRACPEPFWYRACSAGGTFSKASFATTIIAPLHATNPLKVYTAHWHIDYLLPHAKILSIHVFKASKEWECRLSRRLARLEGARVIMKGFGSSDCRCPSHLYYFPSKPHFKGTFLAMGVVRGQSPLTLSLKNTAYPSKTKNLLY